MAKKAEIEQTEIEAPYELPKGWKWIPLLESFENKTSSNKKLPTKDYSNSGKFAVVDQGQEFIGGYSDKSDFVFDGELPIIVFGDHTKCIKYIDFPFIQGADGVKILKPISIVDSKFFYYALQNIHFPDLGYRRHFPIFKDYLFPLPPTLAEQQCIVNRIETMFAKLDQAQKNAQAVLDNFETRKAAILHKAFTGKLTANWRKENGVPDDSWEEKTLGEICSEIKIGPFGSLLHEDDYIENGIPLVNPKHIFNQAIKPDTKVSISNEKADELKSYRLLKNDIVLGRRGEMGRCAPVSENENGWLCGTGSMILRLKPEYQARIYSILISSHKSVLYFEENAVGSTLKNLNEKIVKNLPMPIISLPEQKEIVRILDTVLEKESHAKEAAQTVLDQIALLKKSILARAFRGEL